MNKIIVLSEELFIRTVQFNAFTWGGSLLNSSGHVLVSIVGYSKTGTIEKLTSIARANWGLV